MDPFVLDLLITFSILWMMYYADAAVDADMQVVVTGIM